eukprot:Em0015g1048a
MYQSDTPSPIIHSEYVTKMRDSLEKAYNLVRARLGQKQEAQKQFYDQKCHGDPYAPGDLVWFHSTIVPRGKYPWTGWCSRGLLIPPIGYRIVTNPGGRQWYILIG